MKAGDYCIEAGACDNCPEQENCDQVDENPLFFIRELYCERHDLPMHEQFDEDEKTNFLKWLDAYNFLETLDFNFSQASDITVLVFEKQKNEQIHLLRCVYETMRNANVLEQ